MEKEVWLPSVTVAGVIEHEGKFLLVEEDADGQRVFNQPAGHWEQGETLIEACTREVLEETAWHFKPSHLTGIYRWRSPVNGITYLRFAFCGELVQFEQGRPLDTGILRAVWQTPEEIRAFSSRHRSPLVLRCIEDYSSGKRYPLELINEYE